MDQLLSREKLLSFEAYAERHDIFHMFSHYLEMMLLERPESPVNFLIEVMERGANLKPVVLFVTPPFPIREELGSALAKTLQVPYVSASQILAQALNQKDELAIEAQPYLASGTLVPDSLMNPIMKRALIKYSYSGCLLQGYPSTRGQLNGLVQVGLFPHKIIVLEIPDQLVLDSHYSYWVDPTRGIQNTLELESNLGLLTTRLQNYRISIPLLLGAYSPSIQRNFPITSFVPEYLLGTTVGKNWFEALLRTGDEQSLIYSMASWVYEKKKAKAPFSLRIALINSQKLYKQDQDESGNGNAVSVVCEEKISNLARLLTKRYSSVHINAENLIRYGHETGKVAPVLESLEQLTNEEIARLVKDRTLESDALQLGWVLEGFPQSKEQLQALERNRVLPSRVYLVTPGENHIFQPKWNTAASTTPVNQQLLDFYTLLVKQFGAGSVKEVPLLSNKTHKVKSDLAIYELVQNHLMKATVEIFG